MKNNTARLIAALALVTGFALAQPAAATAAPAEKQPAMKSMMSGMPCMQGMGGAGMADLTAEQQDKMDGLRVAHMKEVLPTQTDLEIKEVELNSLWRADEPDAKKIIAKVKEIGALREKLEVARINHRFAMRNVLTPEQRKSMKKMGMGPGMRGMGKGMGRKMRGMGRGMMGQGGGCGMMGQGMGSGRMGNCPGNCQGSPQE